MGFELSKNSAEIENQFRNASQKNVDKIFLHCGKSKSFYVDDHGTRKDSSTDSSLGAC